MERFWSRVEFGDWQDCWLWRGYLRRDGYGATSIKGANRYVHRVAYELLVGPIPEGLHIDHLCRVPACVNPLHLEAVTNHENVLRGKLGALRERPTECPRGHPYTPENTHMQRHSAGYSYQRCRRCSADKARARRSRQREAVL